MSFWNHQLNNYSQNSLWTSVPAADKKDPVLMSFSSSLDSIILNNNSSIIQLWFDLLVTDVRLKLVCNDQITSMCWRSNVSLSSGYKSTPHLPVSNPQTLVLSGRHFPVHSGIRRKALARPGSGRLSLRNTELASCHHWTRDLREEERLAPSSQKDKPKRPQEPKETRWDLLTFYSVNQRCYLTQVPCLWFSITLMIPKTSEEHFWLHGLYDWCYKDVICRPLPHPLYPPPPRSSLPLPSALASHASPPCAAVLRLQLRRPSCWRSRLTRLSVQGEFIISVTNWKSHI